MSDAFFWLLSLLLFFRLSSGLNLTSGWSRIINHRLTHVSFSSSDRGRFSLLRLHTSLPVCLSVCLSESLLHLRDFSHTAARPCSLYRLCVFCSSTFGPGGKTFNQLIDLVNIYGSETEGETEVEEEEPGGLITNLFDN